MKAGDAFFLDDRSIDTHLWVVISDPSQDAERIVIVSLTTYEDHKEAVCLLDVGDHPRISHKTCIAYNKSRTTSVALLNKLVEGGRLRPQEPVSEVVLARIRNGASLSRKIHEDHLEILLAQRVLD